MRLPMPEREEPFTKNNKKYHLGAVNNKYILYTVSVPKH